jgi:hypothetical protein
MAHCNFLVQISPGSARGWPLALGVRHWRFQCSDEFGLATSCKAAKVHICAGLT